MSKKNNIVSKNHPAKQATSEAKKDNTSSLFSVSAHTFNKVALFICTLILYSQAFRFDYGIDDKLVLNSVINTDTNIKGFLFIFKSWFAGADYRPISILSFWLEKLFFGELSPVVSHTVNIFLYAFVITKIYDFIIISEFYKDEKSIKTLALLCGLIFLIHPNHVSIAANIKARDNLLSMLFGLFASIELIKYFDTRKIYRIIFFILLSTCALLSKLDAYALIAAPIFIVIFFRKINKKKIIYSFVVTLGLMLIAFIILQFLKSNLNESEYIFSMGFDENPLIGDDTFLNRISLSLTTLFYYIKFLVYPTGYYFFFGYNQIPLTGLFTLINISCIIILVVVTGLCLKVYLKNRIYLFSLLFFMISISYALNLYVLVAGIVMDKYNFIASLGFCIAIAALCIDFISTEFIKIIKHPLILSLIFIFTCLTVYRTKDWRNSFTLIEKDMPFLTQSVNANRMAAAAYINLALSEEMKTGYNRVYTDSMINKGERYAIAGLTIYDKVPDLWELRGLSDFYKKDFNQALQYFLKSKEVDSTYLSSINYIGYTYWALNKTDSAYNYFKYVIDREPVFNYSANNMINMLLQNNRKKEVDSLIIVFKKRFPDDKWLNKRIVEIHGIQ